MRKIVSLAFAAAVALAAVVFWAKSGAVVTSAESAGSAPSVSPHEIMTNAKDLPTQQIESLY
jgi:hypothetical protein